MGLLIKLFVLVLAIGIAAKMHLLDSLRETAREAAQQSGASADQVDSLIDMQHWLSISNVMEAVGGLPPPFGSIGKMLVVLILIGLLISFVAACVAAVFRMLRWFRDLTV
jgi:hypothetical protein